MKFSMGDFKLLSIVTIMFAIGIFVVMPHAPTVNEASDAFVASVGAFSGGDGGGDGGCCGGGDGGDLGTGNNTGGSTGGGFSGGDGGGDGGCCGGGDPDPEPEPDAPDQKPPQPVMKPPVCKANGTKVTLSWNSVAEADLYPVRIREVGKPSSERVVDNVSGTSYTFTIEPNTNYEWWVHAYNGSNSPDTQQWSTFTRVPFECEYVEPPVCDVSLSRSSVPAGGGNVTFSWTSNDVATDSTLWVGDQMFANVGVNSGSKTAFITEDTEFRFDIWNSAGSDTCILKVTVEEPEPPAVCDSFTVNKNSVPHGGGNVTLSWNTTDADSVSINNGVGSVSDDGSKTVFVSSNTTFTLTAIGTGGNDSCAVSVTVDSPSVAKCDAFTVTPHNLPYGGGNVTLSWNTTNANSVSINNGVGSVAADDSKTVFVNSDTTFVLTADGTNGDDTCAVSVNVGDPEPPAVCDSFTVNKNSVPYGGGNAVLSWTTTNANSVSINNGVGSVAADDSKTVFVNSNTTFTLTAVGTGGNDSCSVSVYVGSPSVAKCDSFTASKTNLPHGGGNVTLTWTTTNANSVSINNGVGPVVADGSKSVYVNNDTTFTLTAIGTNGNDSCTVSIHVADPEPLPTCDSFTASPNTVPYGGGNTLLEWETTGATAVSINNGVGSVVADGSKTVFVNSNTTFTLTATNSSGSVSCNAHVNVATPSASTCDMFTASPKNLPYGGGTVTLSWNTTNANSVFIDNGVGNVAANDSTNVTVTDDTTFTLVTYSAGGNDTCQVTVHVADPAIPQCKSFTVSPTSLPYGGGTVTLTWDTINADSVSINNGVGAVAGSDSKNVFVNSDTTFVLTASGVGGSDSCQAAVHVADPEPPVCHSFAITESEVVPNGTLTLTWDTSDVSTASINNGIGPVTVDGTNRNYTAPSTPGTYEYVLTFDGQTSAACRDTVVVKEVVPPVSCSDVVFTSSANNVTPGTSVGLSWIFTGNVSTAILEGFGSVIGTSGQTVTVNDTTTYTLKIGNSVNQVSCPLTITVVDEPAPSCDSFTATPLTVPFGGGTTVLTWTTTNADSVSISSLGSQPVNGSQSVYVGSETTYILTATNSSGTDTCPVTVGVGNPPAPICDFFTIAQNKVEPGETLNLSWSTQNADSVSIDRGVGSVAVSGTVTTNAPNTDGIYTYTATVNGGGTSVTCNDTVTVETPTPTPISCQSNVSFVASDYDLPRGGGDVTLTWNTNGLDSVSINGVSSNALDGSETVNVSNDFTFTLTGTKDGETITCPLTVDVASGGGGSSGSRAPECDLDISDDDIRLGESVKLTWETRFVRELTLEDDNGNILISSKDDDDFDSSITVKPGEDTEFTLTVERGSKKRTCDVEVEVAGGGVVSMIENRVQPLVAGISLTQVPYTGFDAGPMLTFIFYALLTIWGLFVAYVVAVRNDYIGGIALARGQESTSPSAVETETTEMKTGATETPIAHSAAHISPATVAAPTADAPANLPTGSAPVIGYDAYTAPVVSEAAVAADVAESTEMTELENRAHMMKTLISSDAMRYFMKLHPEDNRHEAFDDIIRLAKGTFPSEDGWVVLNLARLESLLAADDTSDEGAQGTNTEASTEVRNEVASETTPTTAGSLAEAIVTENIVAAYQLIAHRPMIALADAAADLDAVVRSRKGESVSISDLLQSETASLNDEQLNNVIAALTGALDGTYADEAAAVKMAIMKAVKAIG